MKSSILAVFLALVCVGNSDYGYGPPVRTEYGAPAAKTEWEEFPMSVFEKLLKIEKVQLISRPMVALGSVIVGMGARLLAPVPKTYHSHPPRAHSGGYPGVSVHFQTPGGWGQGEASSVVTAHVEPQPDLHRFLIAPSSGQHGGYYPRAKRAAATSVNPASGLRRSRTRLAQDVKESEEFLERAMGQIVEDNPTEAGQIFKSLRRAYNKILGKTESLAEVAADLQEFKSNSNSGGGGWGKPGLSREIKQYFALISGFDERSCLEKLFCDIHSSEVSEDDEVDQPEHFKAYERNVIRLFKTLSESSTSSNPTVSRYYKAARAGQRPLSNCRQTFNLCPYSTKEIMELGYGLERSGRE